MIRSLQSWEMIKKKSEMLVNSDISLEIIANIILVHIIHSLSPFKLSTGRTPPGSFLGTVKSYEDHSY